ncbi:T9SS type A sorting domain-containing protein [bacterium]|nr:T9SS type A sorting domain-containing protein [bacterium]
MVTRNLFLALVLSMMVMFTAAAESQDTPGTARDLPLDGSVSGVMFQTVWFKIGLPSFGELSLSTVSDSTLVIDLSLYDVDLTLLAGSELPEGTAQKIHHTHLAPGTYYLKMSPKHFSSGFYTVSSYINPARYTGDTIMDNESGQSVQIERDVVYTGFIGFYNRGVVDSVDNYLIVLPEAANFYYKFVSEPTVDIDVEVVETCGCGLGDPRKVLETEGMYEWYYTFTKATTIKVYRHSGGYGSYAFTVTSSRNTSPVIFTKTLKNARVGHLYQESVIAGDVDEKDSVLTYSLLTTPSWLSIDAKGKLSGTPGLEDLNKNNTVSIQVTDKSSNNTVFSTTIHLDYIVDPPTDVTVSDVPGDQGYSLKLTWTLSAVDRYVTQYNIYRSQTFMFSNPVPISVYASAEALTKAEQQHAILLGSVGPGVNSFVDDRILSNDTLYFYWVSAEGMTGESEKIPARYESITTDVEQIPSSFRVYPPYPNPFNPATTIGYEIPVECRVSLVIYDILGREVAVLFDGMVSPGRHETVWNGKNSGGALVGSGVYLYRLVAGSHSARGKVVFVR